jgi:hypothetical protein
VDKVVELEKKVLDLEARVRAAQRRTVFSGGAGPSLGAGAGAGFVAAAVAELQPAAAAAASPARSREEAAALAALADGAAEGGAKPALSPKPSRSFFGFGSS